MVKASVQLKEGYQVAVKLGDHVVITDEPEDAGGQNLGPTPHELMLGSLGACVAVTCKLYANRKQWPLEGVEIDLSTNRYKAAEYPAYTGTGDFVHEFRQQIVFKGPLTPEQKDRLLEIAGKCPVHRALTEPKVMLDEMVDEIIAQEG